MTASAVLVIDVQQALCEGEHAAFEASRVIDRINEVAAKARTAGAPVVFVQHESAAGALAHGSPGWQLAKGLHVERGDLRLRKTTPDAFHRTDLEAILRRHAITDLVICGMHTEFCVDTTTRRALALGYPVVLVEDAHTSAGNRHLSAPQIVRHHNETLGAIVSFGARATPRPSRPVGFEDAARAG
jgi:nicotinamidase-related amidase